MGLLRKLSPPRAFEPPGLAAANARMKAAEEAEALARSAFRRVREAVDPRYSGSHPDDVRELVKDLADADAAVRAALGDPDD